jgi:hypothetical protein
MRAQLWDVGFQAYEPRKQRLLSGARAVMLCYDVSSGDSFTLAIGKVRVAVAFEWWGFLLAEREGCLWKGSPLLIATVRYNPSCVPALLCMVAIETLRFPPFVYVSASR